MTYAMINLSDYQTFESVAEMDQTVKHFNRQLSKSHYETLNLLKQYSLKVIGVSHIKIQTIADHLNKSISTIKRHIKCLKDNGYINVINTTRTKRGGKGANAYIINTSEYRKKYLKNKNELSEMNHRKAYKKGGEYQSDQAFRYLKVKKETIDSYKLFKNLKSTDKRNNNQLEDKFNHRVCPVSVPFYLYNMAKPFLKDKEIEQIHRTLTNKITFFKGEDVSYYRDDIIERAFKQLLNALRDVKAGRRTPIYNKIAYATSTLFYLGMKLNTYKDLDDWIDPICHDGYQSLFT